MKNYNWQNIQVNGYSLSLASPSDKGLIGYMPIFDTYENALEWAGEDSANSIKEIELVNKNEH